MSAESAPGRPRVALFVFGTRPEAIKLAPVIRELRRRPGFLTRVCVTAQHRDLLDQVLRIFRLRTDYDLDIMKRGQTLFDITTLTLQRIQPVLERECPDLLFVQGDTTTAFAAALAAFYRRIPVAHVEAGLRTYDLFQPFPEELNRRLVAPISRFNFAPTPAARANLRRERIAADSVFVSGNTVIDALIEIARRPAGRGAVPLRLSPGQRLVLVTAHRRENFGRPFENVCRALLDIVAAAPDVELAYPVHPNPNVRLPAERLLSGHDRVHLLPPLDYVPFVQLLRRCHLVLSDSGGVQEEAPALGKPVLVLRATTERPEAVRAGTARLVGTDRATIVRQALRLLNSRRAYQDMARARNPFGDGHAARRIADHLEYHYGLRPRPPREFQPDC